MRILNSKVAEDMMTTLHIPIRCQIQVLVQNILRHRVRLPSDTNPGLNNTGGLNTIKNKVNNNHAN